MKTSTYQYLLSDARKALDSRRLLLALSSLRGLATNLRAWNEGEEIAGLQDSYRMMLDYMAKGANDPERAKMYAGFVRRSYELCDVLERAGELENEDSFYALTLRTQLRLGGGQIDWQNLLSPTVPHRNLFDVLWTSPALSTSKEIAIADFLSSAEVDSNRKCLAISALTLAGMRFFDVAKYCILLDYVLDADVQLRVRALVGLLFMHVLHPNALVHYPDVEARLRLMADVPGFLQELEAVQMQLFLSLETKRIEKDLQDEIIPRMMERMKNLKLDRNLGLDELKDKLSEVDLNPEWETDGTPSKLAEYMKEFVELQQRGADMYMGTFKMLKQRFPFFSVACNWFWPFTLEHPELPVSARNNQTLKLMLRSAGLCDSDKYSFSMIVSQMPQQDNADLLRGQMAEAMRGLDGMQLEGVPLVNDFKEVMRSYVQGFYRFCNLYNHREAFVNPFSHNLFVLDYAPFDGLLSDSAFLVRMAEFLFNDKSYVLAKDLLLRIPAERMTAGLYQKLGYCYESVAEIEKAADAYWMANDLKANSLWTLRRLATCLRMSGNYAKALGVYDEMAELQPESSKISMRQAECLIHLERYDDAFKALFKVVYLDPEFHQAERVIGWCSLLTAKYEQAEVYYQKVIDMQPTQADWLNAGHAAWLMGKTGEAIERYRRALPNEDAERFLDDDAQMLRKAGKTDEELALMVDAVMLNRM